jgi:CubicO group peptidase (beta-lactamase class C family)
VHPPLVVSAFLILLSAVPSAARAQSVCERAFQPAADTLAQMSGEFGLNGAALVIRHRGHVVCEVYLGRYDAATEVPLVSAAKWLSAATILTLVDDGHLRLDDSVAKYLQYFKGPKRAITLRQLLSHTAGFPSHHPCMFRATLTLDECARAIVTQSQLASEPGTSFRYGGAGFTVAGRVAEVADGRPWAELFHVRMAQPLGLTHTAYGPGQNPSLSEGLAYSSAAEYATFLQMVLDGGTWQGKRILSVAMVEELTRNQIEGIPIESSPGGTRTYGLGCWRDAVDSATGRAVVLSSAGAGGFIPWINRKRGLVGVVAVFDNIERIYPRAAGLMLAARNGAVEVDGPGAGAP